MKIIRITAVNIKRVDENQYSSEQQIQ